MDDNRILIAALKRALRAQDISYARVASALNLSEATIKRQFSRGGFTLERFQAICALAGTSINTLSRLHNEERQPGYRPTIEHEQMMVRDRRLLLVALCALGNFTVDAIVDRYAITKAEAIRHLLKLDAIGLLKLLPENRIRLRVEADFEWLSNGPMRQFLRTRLTGDYFSSRFDQLGESLVLVHGEFCDDVRQHLITKLKQELIVCSTNRKHCRRSMPGRSAPQMLVLSVRPWDLDEFRELRRSPISSWAAPVISVT